MDWRDWDDASFDKFDSILVPDAMLRNYDWIVEEDAGDGSESSGDGDSGDGSDPGDDGEPAGGDDPAGGDEPEDGEESGDDGSEGSPTETFLVVQDIDLSAAVKGRKLQARAVVQIVDDLGNPVQGALVNVAWSGEVSAEASGLTDANGLIEFRTSQRVARNSSGVVELSVLKVESDSAIFDSSIGDAISTSTSF